MGVSPTGMEVHTTRAGTTRARRWKGAFAAAPPPLVARRPRLVAPVRHRRSVALAGAAGGLLRAPVLHIEDTASW